MSEEWQADFASVELEQLRAAMAMTPEERLQWLEDALKFAQDAGALPREEDRRG